MNLIEVIKKRKSCRTFNQDILNASDKKTLEDFILKNNKSIGNENINLIIVEKENNDKKMKLDYGMIKGHGNYILGKSKSSALSRLNYGYLMEKVVLKATEMNLSTCWVGYFDSEYFQELKVENEYEIPSIVIIGNPKEKGSLQDKFLRMTVKASKRSNWDQLFFNYKFQTPLQADMVIKYADSLEMVRLAPSAGNTQPWRVFFDDTVNEFHFYKKPISKSYEIKGLHDVDLGIALCHFELMSLENGLHGIWIDRKNENIAPAENLQYMMSWKCE
jgi:nitroreductase